MTAFLIRRAIQGAISVLVLMVIVFALSRLTGDPLSLILPIDASPELVANTRERLGLDKSIPEQFATFIADAARGDFGVSITHRAPVTQLFAERYPNTLVLILPSLAIGLLVGVPLAVIGSTSRYRWLRRVVDAIVLLFMSMPSFWFAIVLILWFSVMWGVLPVARMGGLDHYILPVTTMSLFLVAGVTRLVRTSMMESLDSEYIKMARLEGLPNARIVWRHALKNSLTSGISFLGVYFSTLVTGSIVIEKVFAWPGVGRLLYDSVVARDYPLVQGILIIAGIFIVLISIGADLAYAYLDPKVRLDA